MGLTKTELFTAEQNELAQIAKAMGHPARIAIIQYLISCNSCITGEIVEEIGLAQATISQHLRELKSAGIIQGNIEGVSVNYCINKEKWEMLSQLFNELFDTYENKKSCC